MENAILVGSSSEIGEWIGDELTVQGYEVVGISRSIGRYTLVNGIDVGKEDALEDSCRRITKEIRDSKLFIYCCGTSHMSTIDESIPYLWKRDIDINLIGAYNFYKIITKIKTEESEAKFIFLGSTSVVSKGKGLSSYCISKEGLETLVRYINNEGSGTWRAACLRLSTCNTSFAGCTKDSGYINDEDIKNCVRYLIECRKEAFPELISIRTIKSKC